MSKIRVLSHLQLSILLSISLFMITLTFKPYFYYIPFNEGLNLLAILQFLTICGWIMLIAIPPLFMASEFKWSSTKYWVFLLSVSLWTLSTLMIKIYTLILFGQVPYQYLTAYPVLIYFEWIVPALYVYIGIKFYKPSSKIKIERLTNRVRFDDEDVNEDIQHASSSSMRERFEDL